MQYASRNVWKKIPDVMTPEILITHKSIWHESSGDARSYSAVLWLRTNNKSQEEDSDRI